MKIILTAPESKKQISLVRSQIKDVVSLKNFDEFVLKNKEFDFNNDQHLQSLRKISCHCEIDIPAKVIND